MKTRTVIAVSVYLFVLLSAVSRTYGLEAARKRQASPSLDASQANLLLTALPASVLSLAITNPSAINSQFATGTPAWYTALNPDAQSVLTALAPGYTTAASSSPSLDASAANVLLTALPASVLSLAATNAAAINSQFITGTPAWYTALHPDAQSILSSLAPQYMTIPLSSVTSTSHPSSTSPTRQVSPTSSIASTSSTLSTSQMTIINLSYTSFAPTDDASELSPSATNVIQPSATSTNSPTGLSTGGKVGIGVGVPLGAIVVAGIAGAYILGLRKGRRKAGTPSTARRTEDEEAKPRDVNEAVTQSRAREPWELEAVDRRQELAA